MNKAVIALVELSGFAALTFGAFLLATWFGFVVLGVSLVVIAQGAES